MAGLGCLYITATPIGNLQDWSPRAVDTAQKVDLIACEDTRVTGVLLHHYHIKKPLFSYHDHNADTARPKLLTELQSGKQVMLVSDAGTPLISDPGYKLVREAQDLGIKICAIPGPSSVTTAISIAGLPTDKFVFLGFLPNKEEARRKELEKWKHTPATLICFETARRLSDVIPAIETVLGDREIAVARELTKMFESVIRDKASNMLSHFTEENLRGEIVILIAPAEEVKSSDTIELERVLNILLTHLSVKDAASAAADLLSLPRKDAYQCALALQEPQKT